MKMTFSEEGEIFRAAATYATLTAIADAGKKGAPASIAHKDVSAAECCRHSAPRWRASSSALYDTGARWRRRRRARQLLKTRHDID